MNVSFDKADALAKLMEEKQDNGQQSCYESLLSKYQDTIVSMYASREGVKELARCLDIIRHEYLTAIYDVKLWKVRTDDSYPAKRLEEMEKFLREFDKSLKALSQKEY